jgi:predicted Rossmann fold flavoprotein
VYPYSDQANSVVDVLRFALQRPNITLYTGAEVTKVHYRDGSFTVQTEQDSYVCDRLIIACGGLAGTKLGGTMMGYRLLRSLGHSATRLRPALVQLKSGWHGTAALKGIRANCHARILRDGQLYSESTGEIQFTEYGISGPVVFEISRDVCQSAGKWECALDLAPELGNDQLIRMISQRTYAQITAEDLLTGILHNRLGRVIVQAAGIQLQKSVKDVSSQEVEAIVNMIKNFCLELTEPLGMDSAQVTAGGIKTGEFCPDTMESRLVPGLYACGEVLDIDGDCGGYNLQWAWSSGRAAGLHAGEVTV